MLCLLPRFENLALGRLWMDEDFLVSLYIDPNRSLASSRVVLLERVWHGDPKLGRPSRDPL